MSSGSSMEATGTMNIGTAKFMPPEVLCHSAGMSTPGMRAMQQPSSKSTSASTSTVRILKTRTETAVAAGGETDLDVKTLVSLGLIDEDSPQFLPKAPQVKQRYDGGAWDIFSLSLVFVVMWQRSPLLPDISPFAFANAVVRGMRPPIPDGMPEEVSKLLEAMWMQVRLK